MSADVVSLPADTVWLDGGTLGVAIVGGDRCECGNGPHEQGRCMASWPEMPNEARYRPREWAQYDKPGSWWCEGCHASWLEGDQCWKCGNRTKYPVGRQVWTVRWPCPNCQAGHPEHPVMACMTGGIWMLSARASIQVVPVVIATDPNGHESLHVCIQNGAALLNDGPKFICVPPLDPLPTPGRDWGVLFHIIQPERTPTT